MKDLKVSYFKYHELFTHFRAPLFVWQIFSYEIKNMPFYIGYVSWFDIITSKDTFDYFLCSRIFELMQVEIISLARFQVNSSINHFIRKNLLISYLPFSLQIPASSFSSFHFPLW